MSPGRAGAIALRTAAAYFVFAGLWAVLYDPLAALLFTGSPQAPRVQSYKGRLFVPVSGLLLYFLALREVRKIERSWAELSDDEDLYRDLVENSGDLIGTHDLEGKILSVNERVWRMAGAAGAQDLIGRRVPDFLPPEVQGLFQSYLATILHDGQAQGLMKVNTRAGDRILQYNNSLRRDGGKRPLVRCFGRDVTEEKRIEARLRQAQKMEALGRSVGGYCA